MTCKAEARYSPSEDAERWRRQGNDALASSRLHGTTPRSPIPLPPAAVWATPPAGPSLWSDGAPEVGPEARPGGDGSMADFHAWRLIVGPLRPPASRPHLASAKQGSRATAVANVVGLAAAAAAILLAAAAVTLLRRRRSAKSRPVGAEAINACDSSGDEEG